MAVRRNKAPDVFPKVEVFVDRDRDYKQLLLDGRETAHVQDVSVRFTDSPLAEVTVTYVTDDVTVAQASLPRPSSTPEI